MTKPTDLQAAPTEAPMAEALHEPTTQAGKALLRSDFDTTGWGPRVVRRHVTEAILAIEAEAVAAERTRIAEAVSRATPVVFMPEDIERIYAGEALSILPRHAVLALINPAALAQPEDDHE